MWDFVSLKCTNWLVKCNLCASDAVLALERRLNAALCAPELACTDACVHANTFTSASTQKAALKLRAA